MQTVDLHPTDQASVMVNAPDAITKLSPTPSVRGVARLPYQSMLPEPEIVLSQICRPENVAAVSPGPKVAAVLFDAEPAGDAAAAKPIGCRVQPEPVAISDAEMDVGAPSDSPTPCEPDAGWLTAPAPPSPKSSSCFS